MAKDKSTDWIVGDSEDEDEIFNPTASMSSKPLSTISDFSNNNSNPKAQPSTISQFTESISPNTRISAIPMSMEPPPPPAQPPKVPRRPRPAYIVDSNTEPLIPTFTLSQFYAEAEEHISSSSNVNSNQSKHWKDHKKGSPSDPVSSARSSAKTKPVAVINLSSDDDFAQPSHDSMPLSGRTTEPATPAPSDYRLSLRSDPIDTPSTVPTTVPSSSMSRLVPIETPPSSPFNAKKRKRPKLVLDDDLEDVFGADTGPVNPIPQLPVATTFANAVASSSSVQAPEPAAKKARKPREKKAKTKPFIVTKAKAKEKEQTLGSDNASTSLSRAINKIAKQANVEYKSKEFVEDSSDDDIALIPPSNSRTRSDQSDAYQSSVPVAPVDVFVPPSRASSIRPSVVVSIPPSIQMSVAPSVDLTAAASANASRASVQANEVLGHLDDPQAVKLGSPSGGVNKGTMDKQKRKAAPKDKGKGKRKKVQQEESALAETTTESAKQSNTRKGKKRAVLDSDEEAEPVNASKGGDTAPPVNSRDHSESQTKETPAKPRSKERNIIVDEQEQNKENNNITSTPAPAPIPGAPKPPKPSLSQSHVVPRKGSVSDLIRRVSNRPNSPFVSPSPGSPSYSPFYKASRTTLSRIAPLHPNRRTPPPPLPRPPPPKKSKKMLELEEKWEEELAESADGWACMSEEERAGLRRAKRDMELGYDD